MALVKPTIGQANWGTTLNTALDYLNTDTSILLTLGNSIIPAADNTIALGSSAKRFSSVYTEGITFADSTVQSTAAQPLYCGSFENTTTLTNAGTTSSNLVTFDTTSTSNGVSVVSSSQVTFAHTGRYLMNFLGQFSFVGGASNYNITVWWAKNGTIVTNGASTFTTTSAQSAQIMANVEDIIQVNSGDYIQFYWWAGASGISLTSTAAATNPTRPASPSVKLNIFNVG